MGSTRHFHVALTKGNGEGREDERKKVKENEVNKFQVKHAWPRKRMRRRERERAGSLLSKVDCLCQCQHNGSPEDLFTFHS